MDASMARNMDLNIMERFCEIEATVPTGLETLAREEIEEKLGTKTVADLVLKGKVTTTIKVKEAIKLLELRGVDNLLVILNRFHDFPLTAGKEETLQKIEDLIPQLDWDLGLTVWEQFNTFPHAISRLPASAEEVAEVSLNPAQQAVSDTSTASDHETTATPDGSTASNIDIDESVSAAKRRKTSWNEKKPAFRATCYRTGSNHSFQSPDAARAFGGAIQDYFKWNVDLGNYDIECVLNIEGSEMTAGISLTKQSLHKRNIVDFGSTTLRSTISYSILRLCRIKPNEVVCDPMCGSGSIPIEGVLNWPEAQHLCGDLFEGASQKVVNNLNALNEDRQAAGKKSVALDVFCWDATRLPLKEASIDTFVTDLPFGKRSGSKMRNWHLYPKVLEELGRVSKPSTGRACFLTMDKKCFVKTCQSMTALWKRGPTLPVNIGGLQAAIYLLFRTGLSFAQRNSSATNNNQNPKENVKT